MTKVTVDWRRAVGAGVAAAVVWQVVAGIVTWIAGAGFWAPSILMATTVSRHAEGLTAPAAFDPAGVILGMVIQIILSVALAVLIGSLAVGLTRTRAATLGASVLLALMLYLVVWYWGIPALVPESFQVGAGAFAVGYAAWGLVIGALMSMGARIEFR